MPEVTTYIRYFATTDDSPVGALALEYLRSMLHIGPVRVLSVSGGLAGETVGVAGARWPHYAPLLSTPMGTPYVNVVCCDPARWAWTQTVAMPRRGSPTETTTAQYTLYTEGVRNVLCTNAHPGDIAQRRAAAPYQALVVPTAVLHTLWLRDRSTMLIPIPVRQHEVLQRAVLGVVPRQ